MAFEGFPREGTTFLARLARHNSKEWFQANREVYQQAVREPMLALVEALNRRLEGFAPAYVARLPGAVSRPNRDIRFSKDKHPYRTDIAAVFPCKGREKHEAAGFFVRISPEGAEVVGGVFMPDAKALKRIRDWIGRDPESLMRLISHPRLRRMMGGLQGEQLQRIPKEYGKDHPAGTLLRHKQWFFRSTLAAKLVNSNRLETEVAARFEVMTPFVTSLDRALGNL
jgi:uncharacterized protein (TIGR02453 family)